MEWYKIVTLVSIAIFFIIFFFNDKIRFFSFFREVIKLFIKYNDGKPVGVSIISVLSFVVCPIVVAPLLVFSFDFSFDINTSNAILTFFSIIFTILFGSIAIVGVKQDDDNKRKEEVQKQTFNFIIWLLILSIFIIIILIIYVLILPMSFDIYIYKIITALVFAIGIHIILVIFVIIKRTLRLFESEE